MEYMAKLALGVMLAIVLALLLRKVLRWSSNKFGRDRTLKWACWIAVCILIPPFGLCVFLYIFMKTFWPWLTDKKGFVECWRERHGIL